MNPLEFYELYNGLLYANGVYNFRAEEFARVGRISNGVALQVPPERIWEDSLAVWSVLEWLRTELGAPIRVTSGYRDPAYNAAIGGAPHSQHVLGTARDIQAIGVPPSVVADTLERHPRASTLGVGRYRTFTHVDTRGRKARW